MSKDTPIMGSVPSWIQSISLPMFATDQTAGESALPARSAGRTWLCYFGWFVAVLVLDWNVLYEPPVWDAAFSIFPAAITLNENGFDLPALLREPIYMQGGPNCHATSPLAWITAGVIRLTGYGPGAWLTLHLAHIAVAALALLTLQRLARPLLGERLALLATATVLLFPVFHTQTGSMYLDMPVATLTLLGLANWSEGRRKSAVAWTVAAAIIKQTGMIAVGTLAVATLLEARPWPQKLLRSAVIFLLGGMTALPWMIIYSAAYAKAPNPITLYDYVHHNLIDRLVQAPDLCALLAVYVACGILWLPGVAARLAAPFLGQPVPPETGGDNPTGRIDVMHVLPVMFLAFFLVFPLAGIEMYVLLRYYIQVVGVAVVGLACYCRWQFGPRVATAMLLLLATFFVFNRNGDFYPVERLNDFSIAERSAEYADLQAAQIDGVRALEQLDPRVPVFYGLPEHYFVSYPQMGYVAAGPKRGHCLMFDEPYCQAQLKDFPQRFYVLRDFHWLGGEKIQPLLDQVAAEPDRESTTVATFRHGRYQTELVEVRPRTLESRVQRPQTAH